jgi:hypothetical protein
MSMSYRLVDAANGNVLRRVNILSDEFRGDDEMRTAQAIKYLEQQRDRWHENYAPLAGVIMRIEGVWTT